MKPFFKCRSSYFTSTYWTFVADVRKGGGVSRLCGLNDIAEAVCNLIQPNELGMKLMIMELHGNEILDIFPLKC